MEATEAEIPLFMWSYLPAFQSVSQHSVDCNRPPLASPRLGPERNDWNWAESHVRARRSFGGVREDFVKSVTYRSGVVDDGEEFDRMPLRPVFHKSVAGDERGLHYVRNKPVEIGLAWTTMRDFFAGSLTGFQSDGASSSSSLVATSLVETTEKPLKMVLDHVNIQLDGSTFRRKKGKRRRKKKYDVAIESDEISTRFRILVILKRSAVYFV